MPKFLALFLFSVSLSFSLCFPAEASVNEWETQQQNLEQQKTELKDQIKELDEKINAFPDEEKEDREAVINKKLKLGREYSRKANYEEAYKRAIEMATGQTIGENTGTEQRSFIPASLLPGEEAPAQYIPIYKAAGEQYGVDWYVLASIHKIETSYSSIRYMISSVGAQGHMQFMPSTFSAYGVDGDGDGKRSPWDLKDAIFSAANYLSKNRYSTDPRGAIWHYNHAEWYVNKVLRTAGQIKKGSI
ncbi:lytic murein transglycosylase [Fictibacillus sp. KIGAM418]|uniref:Lytic murein transglycosylase n=1 Tax=Fictibacillus marinisediminis TaxID=2878389 RepID=A0A9X2BG38_9BACL|nr:lytic transglycosylase domain-containing protein [Fictibacillus marinisediminis]MCK6259405.1 lytic murein transglycosylase [Fictibacillus marinisediminis]